MPLPKKQTNKPVMGSAATSDIIYAGMPDPKQSGTMYPYDATPALMQAFEQHRRESPSSPVDIRPSNVTLPALSATREREMIVCGRPARDRTSRATFLPRSANLEENATGRRSWFERSLTIASPPLSSARLNRDIEPDRPEIAPLPIVDKTHPASSRKSFSATAWNKLSSAYGRMSNTIGSNSPFDKSPPSPPASPDLEVYKRHESNGRLMICEAREQHCSNTVKEFLGERTSLRGIEELKTELLRILEHLGEGGKARAKAELKVVTGNMLERIVAWDLNQAEALEQPDVPLLSTVPTAETLNKVDAIYILKMFRSGMKKMPSDDVRRMVGFLPDEDLMALLHFTLLLSRPVLVWELDLDEI